MKKRSLGMERAKLTPVLHLVSLPLELSSVVAQEIELVLDKVEKVGETSRACTLCGSSSGTGRAALAAGRCGRGRRTGTASAGLARVSTGSGSSSSSSGSSL